MPVDPLRARGVSIVGGQTFYFCSTQHRDEFARNPDKFRGEASRPALRFDIEGMTCEKCVGRVQEAIRALPGVAEVKVDLETHSAAVSPPVDPGAVEEAVRGIKGGRYSARL